MLEASFYKDLGRMIAERRRRMDFSQADVAKLIGISRASLANIEVGRQRLLVHQLYALARALKLEPSDLLPVAREHAIGPVEVPLLGEDLTPKQRLQIERLLNVSATRLTRGDNA